MKKIDMHGHLGSWDMPIPPADPARRLVTLCEREGIEYVVCSSALALQYDMVAGNAELAEAAAAHEPILGYVYVNPNTLSASVEQMERYLPTDEFVGVKIHPRLSGVPENAPKMAAMMDEVARCSHLLLIHTVDQNAARQMGVYAEKSPELNIILAHAAHTDYLVAAQVAADHPNIYLDFCCEWPGAGKIERALEICGAQRIVFGSDMDLLDPAFTRGMFESAGLTDMQQKLIYHDNAAKLIGDQIVTER